MSHYGNNSSTATTNNSSQSNSNNQNQQKHDIFVGNLAFSTTEEQLHQAFSEIGRIIKVRMVSDLETGKPRGFAFIEFEDPQAALSAIRNMNDYELNGRRIRVNFSNSSHLETLAGKLGMDMSAVNNARNNNASNNDSSANNNGSTAIADVLKSMTKLEMYDIVSQFKEIADKDPDNARKLLSGHPQLPEAMLHLMSKLDMIKNPIESGPNSLLPTATTAVPVVPLPTLKPPTTILPPTTTATPLPPIVPADPRAALQQQQQQQTPSDPRAAAAMDPRLRSADPRASMQYPPPPTMLPPPRPANAIDPSLAQQIMALTPQQIAQLPPEKQASIIQLRKQLTGVR